MRQLMLLGFGEVFGLQAELQSGASTSGNELLPFEGVSSKLMGLLVFDVDFRLCNAWTNYNMGCRMGDLQSGLSVVGGVVVSPFGVDRWLVLSHLLDFDVD